MKFYYSLLLFLFSSLLYSQNDKITLDYSSSDINPYGAYNPQAPDQIKDFDPLIGICDCESIRRNPDGTWQDTTSMVWKFKYILNGTAIQDETWSENGFSATSIRQFHPDSLYWIVSYYSSRSVNDNVNVWRGNLVDENIVLSMPQKSPNGLDGMSRLTFYDISRIGFKWKGEWVSTNGAYVYPFWTINCIKRE